MPKVFKGTINFTEGNKCKCLDIKFRGGYLVGENVTKLRSVEEIKELATTLLVVNVTLLFNNVDERIEYLNHVERILRASQPFVNKYRMKDMINIISSNDYLCKFNVMGDRRVC